MRFSKFQRFGVLAIGHLQAAQHHRRGYAHVVDGSAAQLDVDGLSADDVGRAGHDVGGGDAAGDGHANAGIVRLNGVQRPQRRLHRPAALIAVVVRRYVRTWPNADVRMRVHQTRDDRLAAQVDDLGAFGDGRIVLRADGDDLALLHDQHAFVDGRAGRRQDASAAIGSRSFLRRGAVGGEKKKHSESRKSERTHRPSPRLRTTEDMRVRIKD